MVALPEVLEPCTTEHGEQRMTEQGAVGASIPFRRYEIRDDQPWTLRDTERYHAGGYNGVKLYPERGSKLTLEFVRDLQGLRYVEVSGPVADDTPVFDVPALEDLTILTGSKKPLRLEALPLLRRLAVHHRPGLEGVASLPGLTSLFVGRWQGPDLAFLGDKPKLESLRLEGRRKLRASLDGIERAPHLDELMVLDVRIESIEPLRGLTNLREIHLTGVPGMEEGEPWDLTVLTGKPRLEWFHAASQGSAHTLAPLREIPSLVSFGIGANILDGDLSPYVDLPPHVSVGMFESDAQPHYSHTPKEINRIRDAMRTV